MVGKHVFQKLEKKLTSNINEQKRVFVEEFENLKQQLVTLDNELKSINKLKLEKQEFDKKIEVLEMLSKYLNIIVNLFFFIKIIFNIIFYFL